MSARKHVNGVDLYATGVLAQLFALGRCLNPWWMRAHPWPSWIPRHPRAGELRELMEEGGRHWRRNGIRHALTSLRHDLRRRTAWRGWYAEPRDMTGVERIGTGWTERRALADLARARQEFSR